MVTNIKKEATVNKLIQGNSHYDIIFTSSVFIEPLSPIDSDRIEKSYVGSGLCEFSW